MAFCALIFMLYDMRKKISEKYLVAGVFLVFLAVGNSLYFFGRSHEHNIVNLSAIFIMCIFMLVDLIWLKIDAGRVNEQGKRVAVINAAKLALPLIIIAVLTVSYSGRILSKVDTQVNNMTHNVRISGHGMSADDLKLIKELTNNSDKVYFCSVMRSFLWYYYGKYKMTGYYNPFSSWVFRDDLVKFLQKLLGEGYYLIIENVHAGDLIDLLKYDVCTGAGGYTCLYGTIDEITAAPAPVNAEKTKQ
jgi:hypothetical protein